MNGPNSKNERRLQLLALGMAVLFVIVLLITGMCSQSRAGELRLEWVPNDGGPVAEGYRVAHGTASPPADETDVGGVLTYTYSALQNCATHYFAVRAYAGAMTSQPSTEVSVYPRPDITNVLDSETGTQEIIGSNFDQNIKVFIDAGSGFVQLPPGDVNRLDCTKIRIPDIPLLRVQVANVALPLGHGEPKDIFSQPWPGPVVTVE